MILLDESKKRLAIFRIVLGTAQIMAATMALVFFLQTGTSLLTYVAAGTALGLVIASRIIFRNQE